MSTRRSVSVRGNTYSQLRAYCDKQQRSMSDVVEEVLAPLLKRSSTAQEIAAGVQAAINASPPDDIVEKVKARLRFNPPPVKVKGVPKANPARAAARLERNDRAPQKGTDVAGARPAPSKAPVVARGKEVLF